MVGGIELLANGVEPGDAVLREDLHEDGLGHLDALVEADEMLVVVGGGLAGELLLGHNMQRAVEVVDAVEEVGGELLDGEVTGRLLIARAAVLERAEVGKEAEVLVLKGREESETNVEQKKKRAHDGRIRYEGYKGGNEKKKKRAYLQVDNLLLLGFKLLLQRILHLLLLSLLSLGFSLLLLSALLTFRAVPSRRPHGERSEDRPGG